MKRIRTGAVLIAVSAILVFLTIANPLQAAAVPAATTVTLPTAENAYCAKGDLWTGSSSDGPAQLPQSCVYTGLDGSPSPGKIISLASGGNVITALKSASCGDTIQLQQGGSFTAAGSSFPSKNCDSNHWITIRTSAPDSALPPEGARINPSYAGISSLPGRPPYSGPNKNVMAKLVVPNSPITLGDHYRLIGLEITRPTNTNGYSGLVAFNGSHIILDRNWLHGDPTADTTHLVETLPGASHVAIVNSYMTDAHCKQSAGYCSDAQDWSDGGQGAIMKAYNNFMEASGQSILFGGAAAAVITSDIEIRLNHMFKPLTWNPLDKTYFGTKFIVKNNFELKEGQRILLEGNIMENTWGGFSQAGANIVLTPKNQSAGKGKNVCPMCFVSDITVRYNYVVHGSQGLQIANAPSSNGAWSLGGHNYSIHDVVFDGMQYAECYQCANFLNQLSSGYLHSTPPPAAEILHDVSLDHLTIVTAGFIAPPKTATGFMDIGGPPSGNPTATPRIDNFQVMNSIGDAGTNGAYSLGGGSDDCSVGVNTVAAMVSACWTGSSSFTANVLVTDHAQTTIVLPTGNFTTSAWTKVGFVNFNSGTGGDYHLQTTSNYHNAGTDGKDLGADIDTVNAAKTFAQ